MIQVNGEPAFRVLDADVDPDLDQTTEQVAEQATARLGQALAEIAEARNARAMLPALGWTLLATAVLALCLWAVVRGYRWSAARVRAAFERRKLRYGTGWQGQLLGAADPATLAVAPLRFLAWLVALFLGLHLDRVRPAAFPVHTAVGRGAARQPVRGAGRLRCLGAARYPGAAIRRADLRDSRGSRSAWCVRCSTRHTRAASTWAGSTRPPRVRPGSCYLR